ncbi:MAG: adenylate/guanylate cyclase domain-containing protein [Candidatus Muiribacteriota bacterium]
MARYKSKNLSIMMTDMQGYTAVSSNSSRESIVELIRKHNKLMLPVFEFYNGKIIKTIGDAFLVTFDSATDAVVCGIVIQLILTEYNRAQLDESLKLNLRVVINTGDVALEENDIYGEAVNITARMESLDCFPGGTIGISESTYLLINRNEIVANKIGEFELKGIPYKVSVYNVPLESQNMAAIPVKLLKLAEKAAFSGSNFEHVINDWNSSVKSFLDESVSPKFNSFKEKFINQTGNIFEDFNIKTEELKDGFMKKTEKFREDMAKHGNKFVDSLNKFGEKFK